MRLIKGGGASRALRRDTLFSGDTTRAIVHQVRHRDFLAIDDNGRKYTCLLRYHASKRPPQEGERVEIRHRDGYVCGTRLLPCRK